MAGDIVRCGGALRAALAPRTGQLSGKGELRHQDGPKV